MEFDRFLGESSVKYSAKFSSMLEVLRKIVEK